MAEWQRLGEEAERLRARGIEPTLLTYSDGAVLDPKGPSERASCAWVVVGFKELLSDHSKILCGSSRVRSSEAITSTTAC